MDVFLKLLLARNRIFLPNIRVKIYYVPFLSQSVGSAKQLRRSLMPSLFLLRAYVRQYINRTVNKDFEVAESGVRYFQFEDQLYTSLDICIL